MRGYETFLFMNDSLTAGNDGNQNLHTFYTDALGLISRNVVNTRSRGPLFNKRFCFLVDFLQISILEPLSAFLLFKTLTLNSF